VHAMCMCVCVFVCVRERERVPYHNARVHAGAHDVHVSSSDTRDVYISSIVMNLVFLKSFTRASHSNVFS